MIPFSQTIEVKTLRKIIFDVNARLEQLGIMMLDSEEIEVKAGIGLNAMVLIKLVQESLMILKLVTLTKKIQNISVVGYMVKQDRNTLGYCKKIYNSKVD